MPDLKQTIAMLPELHQAVLDYASVYSTEYGHEEPIADLIPAMLSTFLATDCGFAKAREGLPERKR